MILRVLLEYSLIFEDAKYLLYSIRDMHWSALNLRAQRE